MVWENNSLFTRDQKCHELRFFKFLISLSEEDVEWKFFRETLRYICVAELEEITEEKNCKNKCGYVLCNNSIIVPPNAIYSLNTSKNQIFKISKRKKYCSDWCYGAYKHISSQVPSEPLWKNKEKFIDKIFTLYPKCAVGCPGELHSDEEIDATEDEKTISNKEISTNYTNVIRNYQNKSPEMNVLKTQMPTRKQTTKVNECINIQENPKKVKSLEEVLNKIRKNTTNNPKCKMINLEQNMNNCRMSLITSDEKILKHLEKVKSNVCDWMTWNTPKFPWNSSNCDFAEYQENTDERCEEIFKLPTLDSADQMEIRRNILISKALTACNLIIEDFLITTDIFLKEFEKFLCNCRLTAKNISFSNNEIKWLMIVIIDLLPPKFEKVDYDKKAFILKKHGLSQCQLYEKVLEEIKSCFYHSINTCFISDR